VFLPGITWLAFLCHFPSLCTVGSLPSTAALAIDFDDVCETAESYGSGVSFYGSEYEPFLASIELDQIFKKSLCIMKCSQEQAHPQYVKIINEKEL